MSGITRGILAGTEPSDSVDIEARDFGVAFTDDGSKVFITVDGGNVGLLRLVSSPELAKALVLLVAKAVCESERLCL